MNKKTSLAQRVQIIELAEAGLTDRQMAKQVGWSCVFFDPPVKV